jgi:hypothetical protein
MPSPLPTEMIHDIIRYSLPTVSYNTCKERYRLLLGYSLVHSIWREIARAELLKELFLKSASESWEAYGMKRLRGKRYHLGKRTRTEIKPDARLRSLWRWRESRRSHCRI